MAPPVWRGGLTLEMQKGIGFQLAPQAESQVCVQESFELLLHCRRRPRQGCNSSVVVESMAQIRQGLRAHGHRLAAAAGAGRTEESAKTRTKRALVGLQVTGTLRTVQELRRIANHHQQL